MNIPTIHRRARGWHAATIAAMALLGIAHGPVAGASDAGADRGRDAPVWQQVVERRQLRHVVARMPSGWPATEVMRRAIEEPLGDVVQRADWRRAVDRMPAGWPATEAMRVELER
jgi:hypothetical protein